MAVDPVFFRLFELGALKGDVRKAQIITAAIECIATVGIEDTTFDAIGKRLNIRRSHVAYHFADKPQIIESAIRYITAVAQETTVELLKAARSRDEKLAAVVEGAFRWAREQPEQATAMLLLHYYASFRPEYRRLHHQIRASGAVRLATILEGHPRALGMARQIQFLITGSLLECLSTQKKLSEIAEIKNELITTVLFLAHRR